MYSIDAASSFKELGYRILPTQKVDYELIVDQWDDILRLVTTIKLGPVSYTHLIATIGQLDRNHFFFLRSNRLSL